MRGLFIVFVLILVGAALGFYRGWFHFSTNSANQAPSATITVDKDKFHADENMAKNEVEGLVHKAKEETGDLAGKAKQ